MITKFRYSFEVNFENIVTEENKVKVNEIVDKIKGLDLWSFNDRVSHITLDDKHGMNSPRSIISQTIVNNEEEKKLFIDIFHNIVKVFEKNRPLKKMSFKQSQRENKWSSESLPDPVMISYLYELRHHIRPLFVG